MVRNYYPFGYSGYQFLERNNTHYIESELLPDNSIRVIECYIDEKWMKVKSRVKECSEWNEMNLNNLQRCDTIDLSENGDRWEGDSLNGNPFGYGCLYNSENQIIYSGFVYEGLKVCYGTEMYGDVGLVEYEGGYYKGMRYGNGKLYDKKNELIYEGEWYMNNPLETSSVKIDRELKEEDIHFGLEEIVIGENCLKNVSCFKLIGFNNLKKLVIYKNRLKRMKLFCIENCNELVDVIMDGENNWHFINNESGIFRICNCPNCEDVIIGDNWFANCNSVELNSIFYYLIWNIIRSS